jgi:hypothetical protein
MLALQNKFAKSGCTDMKTLRSSENRVEIEKPAFGEQ